MIIEIYKNTFNSNFRDEFFNKMNNDITDIVTGTANTTLAFRCLKRYKAMITRFFELLQYLNIYNKTMHMIEQSDTNMLYLSQFSEFNEILRNVIRPWYESIIGTLYN